MSRYDEQNYYYGRMPETRDTYDPEIGYARGVGRDGYAADDASQYTSREHRHKGPRYLEYAPDGSRYGQGAGYSKSYDDLRSRRDRDHSDDEDDERQVARRKSRNGSRRSSRHRDSKKRWDDLDTPDQVGQSDWKKWGATIAGAAVGAYGVHKGVKSNKGGGGNEDYIGAAVGAVVGGLIAREAEKEWYKHKASKETEIKIDDDRKRRH